MCPGSRGPGACSHQEERIVAENARAAGTDADNVEQVTVILENGELRYAPPVTALIDAPKVKGAVKVTGYSGTVTFDYAMANASGTTDVATVTITVTPERVIAAPVVPVAAPIAAAAPAVAAVSGTLAQTGADSGLGALAGLLLMTIGTVAVWLTRRARRTR